MNVSRRSSALFAGDCSPRDDVEGFLAVLRQPGLHQGAGGGGDLVEVLVEGVRNGEHALGHLVELALRHRPETAHVLRDEPDRVVDLADVLAEPLRVHLTGARSRGLGELRGEAELDAEPSRAGLALEGLAERLDHERPTERHSPGDAGGQQVAHLRPGLRHRPLSLAEPALDAVSEFRTVDRWGVVLDRRGGLLDLALHLIELAHHARRIEIDLRLGVHALAGRLELGLRLLQGLGQIVLEGQGGDEFADLQSAHGSHLLFRSSRSTAVLPCRRAAAGASHGATPATWSRRRARSSGLGTAASRGLLRRPLP